MVVEDGKSCQTKCSARIIMSIALPLEYDDGTYQQRSRFLHSQFGRLLMLTGVCLVSLMYV